MYSRIKPSHIEPTRRVLIVENDRIQREIVAKILNRYLNCDVDQADDAGQAISYLKSNRYGLMVSGLIFPGMSGVDLIEKVNTMFPEMKILVITGGAHESEIEAVRAIGVRHVIYKPFKIATLLSEISAAICEEEIVNEVI